MHVLAILGKNKMTTGNKLRNRGEPILYLVTHAEISQILDTCLQTVWTTECCLTKFLSLISSVLSKKHFTDQMKMIRTYKGRRAGLIIE
jgi:hypothetical protein